MDGVEALRALLCKLVPNVNRARVPSEMNIVFDGGVFNGYYGLGVGLYLQELEKQGVTRVCKVSGVSIGAVLALWYLLDSPKTDLNALFVKMAKHFERRRNLRVYRKLIAKFIYESIPSDDLSFMNDRLYISYYDTRECMRKTVSRYKSRAHLVEVAVRSGHIPFVISDSIAYRGRYIDGVRPEVFPGPRRSLFVHVATVERWGQMFSVGTEANIMHRLTSGAADADSFFTTGFSRMCGYTDDWNLIDRATFGMREIVMCVLYRGLALLADAEGDQFDLVRGLRTAAQGLVWGLVAAEQ
jgi:hypothetical protein